MAFPLSCRGHHVFCLFLDGALSSREIYALNHLCGSQDHHCLPNALFAVKRKMSVENVQLQASVKLLNFDAKDARFISLLPVC
ncbi:hypothetical protein GALMADRAFT_235352 [Galerina marginata CBS 339.88]|uniref:Uncharacterized protein n=1 Tax=Galerina marginata (strain CBS 339.88) TaxID=685588 RepID=A0A067U1F6_GALM3|nr:hypothetical protein GALMADRAFT_235352 [Galerina marginata CBS 339.88]